MVQMVQILGSGTSQVPKRGTIPLIKATPDQKELHMTVPVPTEEIFLILKRYLPPTTYMSSAYRSPQDQLRVIQDLVRKYNADPRNKEHQISLPHHLSVDLPHTWLPALVKLRKHFAVMAPVPVSGKITIGASPHSAFRVVFDLANQEKTSQKLHEIKEACIIAEKHGLVGFNQIKIEPDPKQMAVHLDVSWVSSRALNELWTTLGYATA